MMLLEHANSITDFYASTNQSIKEVLKQTEDKIQIQIFSQQMMENLINDLLDLAKIQKNQFHINKEYFNLAQIMESSF